MTRTVWQTINRQLEKRLEHFCSVPMFGIALLILPILAPHFIFKEDIAKYSPLADCTSRRNVQHLVCIFRGVDRDGIRCRREGDLLQNSLARLGDDSFATHFFGADVVYFQGGQAFQGPKSQSNLTRVQGKRLRSVAIRGLRALRLLEALHRLPKT